MCPKNPWYFALLGLCKTTARIECLERPSEAAKWCLLAVQMLEAATLAGKIPARDFGNHSAAGSCRPPVGK
jgi:hypothetical protein